MGRLNVHESSYNRYYETYEESSDEDTGPLPICFSCQKESLSLNLIRQCVPCEINQDEQELTRVSDLPLCELENIEQYNGQLYWRFKRINY